MSISAIQAASGLKPPGLARLSPGVRQSQESHPAFAALLTSAVDSCGLPTQLRATEIRSPESEKMQTVENAPDAPQEGRDRFAVSATSDDKELEEVFQKFVGRTFFGLMLKEMRKSIHKTPYFHGGLAEEVFEQHLDMTLAEKLAESSGEQFSKPMYELFRLQNHR